MRYLKKYEQHQDKLKGFELYESLTLNLNKEERKAYNYILGITNENYENLSESAFSNIMDKVKSVAKKGVLTATLFSTLMNTPAFSQQYNTLSPDEKIEIQQLVKKGGEGDDKLARYEDSESITIDLGSYFKSGKYNLSSDEQVAIASKLKPVKDFIAKNGGDVKVTIISSESKVPNKDAETGDRLGKGELSQKRYEVAKSILAKYLGDVEIKKDIKVGGPDYKGDDVNQDKYASHQFVKVKVTINKDVWSFKKIEKGGQANKENGYVGAEYRFDASKGSGVIKLEPGSIPDRCKVFVDGKEVGDTGFFSDKEHSYSEFNYVPLYVLSLTKMYNENPNGEAIEGVRVVTVNSVEQLNDILLKDKSYNLDRDNRTRSEINAPYKELLSMVSSGKAVKIALYEKVGKGISLTLSNDNKEVKVKVYSPVKNTEFSVYAQAGSN